MLRFLVSVHSWHTLKVIGASYFSTFTIMVPLLGYLIFFGSLSEGTYSIDLKALGKHDVELGINEFEFIRLKLTYVGLSIIGFTTIVFKMMCPKEVSVYRDDREYIENAIATAYPNSVDRLKAELSAPNALSSTILAMHTVSDLSFSHTDERPAARIARPDGARLMNREDWLNNNLNALNQLFSVKYDVEDYSFLILRTLILISYVIGFVLVLLPSFQIFGPIAREVIAYL